MKKILFISAAMLAVSTTAQADAYQCKDKDGSTVVRSVPCADYDEFKRTGIMPKHDLPNSTANTQNEWKGTDKAILNHDAMFCTSKKLFDQLAALNDDKIAFARLYSAAVENYQCRMTYKGQRLYVMDTHLFSGLAEVRFPGSPKIWWTNIEYVMPK